LFAACRYRVIKNQHTSRWYNSNKSRRAKAADSIEKRVDVGQGWEVALILFFPKIFETSLDKSGDIIPANTFQISGAPLGFSKQLTIYSSLRSGLGPPPFNFYDEIGPFAKRSVGEYWIHGGTRKLAESEVQGCLSALREVTIEVKSLEQIEDAMLFWCPKVHLEFPAVICLSLGKENIRVI